MRKRLKARLPLAELAAARRWHDAVIAGGCVMCRHYPPTVDLTREIDVRRVQAHHVLSKQRLKREGLHAHLWDERNGLALCVYHHERHTNFVQRVPRALVIGAEHFAAEHGLLWLLDREYAS